MFKVVLAVGSAMAWLKTVELTVSGGLKNPKQDVIRYGGHATPAFVGEKAGRRAWPGPIFC
jgi:hypothetical protein